ncbi:MAG: tripartite tricarboxylate transporter substrate binding protein [Betaproteobacteria bacterium]|nr:tripartite tricarboxylate transporter substrate binding protein [Betaproteobacteria bacterium]
MKFSVQLWSSLLIVAAGLQGGTGVAFGQSYPTKPVRLIIPFGAGGATDVVTRIIVNKLPDVLGQQVVVDNRTGAGGLIGTELAARAPADGYTLIATGTPHVIVPNLYKKLPYDPLKDFAPIMQFGSQPYALTIHPSLGVNSVAQLIELAKKKPGAIDYASSGNGGAQHLFAAMFASMAKIDLRHIPYKGSGMARADLLGGQVKLGCLGVSSVIHSHRAGQLRMLAVTSAQRSAQLPDIPSIAETVPGYEATLWSGMLAPAGTPPAVINRMYGEMSKLLQRPDVKTALIATGTDIVVKDPKEFAALLRIEFDKWGRVVREIKLQIN